jgi:hypothetical protein
MSQHSTTIENIRKARSVQDLSNITQSISTVVNSCQRVVKNLSRASTRQVISMTNKALAASDDDEIKIDHSGVGVKKVKLQSPSVTPVAKLLSGFKPPKMTSVTQYTDTINALYDKSLELDSIEAYLTQAFAGSRGQPAAVKAVRELKKNIDATLQKAFTSLAKVSATHLPKELKTLGDSVVSFLIDNLDKETYSNMSESSYVFRTKDNKWHYTFYVTIEGLKNESNFVFDDYNVVLSAIIDKTKKVTYYLTTLVDFKVPGKFPLGKNVESAADIKNVLGIMLRHNDVINVLDKKSLPLNSSSAKKQGLASIPGVKDASVEDDTLTLTLTKKSPTPAEVNKIVTKVLPILNLIVGNKSKKSSITWKLNKGMSAAELQFILVSTMKDNSAGLNADKLLDLQHALDLTDGEVAAIKTALKSTH